MSKSNLTGLASLSKDHSVPLGKRTMWRRMPLSTKESHTERCLRESFLDLRAMREVNDAKSSDSDEPAVANNNKAANIKRSMTMPGEEELVDVFSKEVSAEHVEDTALSVPLATRMSNFMTIRGQLVMVVLLHTLATIGVFQHFFHKKFLQRAEQVPDAAPNHWQKRMVPSFEFGAMHSLLFTMALLPLTMCRFTITKLRNSWFGKYFPFDYMIEFHKWLGYVMGVQLLVTFLVFVGHFAKLCDDYRNGIEKENFCESFRTEIMITGYAIIGIYLVMWFSSLHFIRGKKYFEVFYYTHHLFFAMYGVLVLHTLDDKVRDEGLERSQAWKWIVFPLPFYAIDRTIVALSSKKMKVRSGTLFFHPAALVLEIEKPAGFTFKAGQYVSLMIPQLTRLQWHPFSIASAPNDETIRVAIKARGPGSWTRKLFDFCDPTTQSAERLQEARSEMLVEIPSTILDNLDVWVMGPFGSPSQDVRRFEHAVLVGAGTGVVPMLSQVKDLIHRYAHSHPVGADATRLNSASDSDEDGDNEVSTDSMECEKNGSITKSSSVAASGRKNDFSTSSPVAVHEGVYVTEQSSAYESEWKVVQRWIRRKLEGCKYSTWSIFFLAIDFTAMMLMISLTSLHRYESLSHDALRTATGVTLGVYCFEGLMRFTSVWNEPTVNNPQKWEKLRIFIDATACVVMLVLYCSFYNTYSSYGGVEFAAFFARMAGYIWRVCMRWYTNPLSIQGSSHVFDKTNPNDSRVFSAKGIGALRSVKMLWVCHNLNAFRWVRDELVAVQELANKVCPSFLDLQVCITGTHVSRNKLRFHVEGSALEGHVTVAYPALVGSFRAMQLALHNESEKNRRQVVNVGVFFSGNLNMEWTVSHLARNFASDHYTRFYFRTENRDIVWKQPSRKSEIDDTEKMTEVQDYSRLMGNTAIEMSPMDDDMEAAT